MKDEEIIEYFKKNKERMFIVEIAAHVEIIAKAIIEKGWITEEKFDKLVAQIVELRLKETAKSLNDEQKKTIKEISELNKFKKGDE